MDIMISFIVIGRNEALNLSNCIESIYETIKYNNLLKFEIIYVDSKSTDNSITIASSFQSVKVFLITGDCNAAIARNIGAKEAKGDLFFFIDADMEISKEFLSNRIFESKNKNRCLTGHLDDYLYNEKGEFLSIRNRTYKLTIKNEEQIIKSGGGIFLIYKESWKKIGAMKTKFKINEDIDFTFRLKNIGIDTVRLPVLIAKHHTIDYLNEKRMFNDFKQFHSLYPGMLLRDHLTKIYSWNRLIRNNYSAFLLLLSLSILILKLKHIFIPFFAIYFSIFFLRVWKNTLSTPVSSNRIYYFSKRSILQFTHDIFFWIGFFFFFPQQKKTEYVAVN